MNKKIIVNQLLARTHCATSVPRFVLQVFHAIIGDPPYGVRAGAKKISNNKDAPICDPATHIARTGESQR
jgi:tRNA G10  N-methylase Trm11